METETTVTQETPAKAARWEDFVDLFIAPADLFRRRASEGWGIPMIAASLLALVVFLGFPSVQSAFADAQIQQMIAKRPELAERMANRPAGSNNMNYIMGAVVTPIAMVVFVALGAFLTWGIAKLTSVQLSWRKALMINAWISIIGVINQLAINVAALIKVNRGEALHPIADRSVGIVRFINPDETNAAVTALLTRVDVFAVWALVLMALGLIYAADAPRPRAWATAAIVYVLLAVLFMIPLALS